MCHYNMCPFLPFSSFLIAVCLSPPPPACSICLCPIPTFHPLRRFVHHLLIYRQGCRRRCSTVYTPSPLIINPAFCFCCSIVSASPRAGVGVPHSFILSTSYPVRRCRRLLSQPHLSVQSIAVSKYESSFKPHSHSLSVVAPSCACHRVSS